MGIRAIILALIGIGGSGVSLVKPYWGLLLLAIFYFFRPDVWSSFVTPVKWLTVAAMIGWLANHASQGGVFKGNLWLIGLLGMYIITTVFAPHSNMDSYERLELIFKIFVVVFLISKLCDTPSRLAGFVIAMAVGCLWFVKVCVLSWRGSGFGDVRVDALAGQGGGANYIAWSLVVVLPFLYYKALVGKGWLRAAALVAIPFFLISVIATGSRGGLLCLVASTAVFLLMMRRFTVILACLVGAVMFYSLAPASYLERMGTITTDPTKMDDSSLSRYQNYRIGLAIMADYPMFGTGLQTFPVIKHRYKPADYRGGDKQVAHNTFIQMGSELGVPFLGVFLLLNALAVWRLLRRARTGDAKQDDDLNFVRVGTLAALVATWAQMVKGDMAQTDLMWWIYGIAFAYHHLARSAVEASLSTPKKSPERPKFGRANAAVGTKG